MKAIFVNGIHDYNYTEENGVHSLYFSEGEEWNSGFRGQLALSLKDTGNDVVLKKSVKKLNYGEAERLLILLKLASETNVIEVAEKKIL